MLFPNDAVFQVDDSPKHTARSIQSWSKEHEDALHHILWPAQSLTLNIIGQLEEEWYSIPQETIQNFYETLPRRIQAVLQANGDPTPY
jgi:hypothetical protein